MENLFLKFWTDKKKRKNYQNEIEIFYLHLLFHISKHTTVSKLKLVTKNIEVHMYHIRVIEFQIISP